MNHPFTNRKKVTIAIALIAIIAASTGIYLQNNPTTQAAIITPHEAGLVGWWRFDEGTGIIASDSSGNGNTGTLYGGTWVDGKYSKAISLDGASNYVDLGNPSALQLTNNFAISAWVNPSSFNAYAGIVTTNSGNGPALSVHSDGHLIFSIFGVNNYHFTGQLTTGTYNHVVVVVSGGIAKLYLNGVYHDQVSIGSIGSFSNWLVGGKLPRFNYFNGIIDDVRVYNRTLSAAEIQGDFKSGPDFAASVLAKVPQGTTQFITTLVWSGSGTLNATIVTPSLNYTENMLPSYQKSSYSTTDGVASMLNIKRLSVSVSALPSDQNWYIALTLDKVDTYQITVEVQK
jgi:hypothetical protein